MSEVKDGSFEAGLIEFRRTESLRGQRISQTDIAFVCVYQSSGSSKSNGLHFINLRSLSAKIRY